MDQNKWVVVDDYNKVIESFRLKSTAIFWIEKNKKNYFNGLRVIEEWQLE